MEKIWSNKNYRISIIIGGLVALWLLSGIFKSDNSSEDKDAAAQQASEALTEVRARQIQAQSYPLIVSVKGQTEANRRIDIRAEVSGQIVALPLSEGSTVKSDEVICRLAVEDRELRVSEAKAAADQAQIEYDGAVRLKSGGYQSETAIASAKSRLESAKANLLRREIDLAKTAITAPFDGVIDDRPVEIGDLVRAGDICATVLDLDPLIVSGQVSEDEVVKIAVGGKVQATLVGGHQVSGTVKYISRRADDVTRTFRIEAEIENDDMNLFDGVTADMNLYTRDVDAHLISASLLILDDDGDLGIRILDSANRVVFSPVELIGDAPNGVWVTGLPEVITLITVGHQYVGEGDEVKVAYEDNAPVLEKKAPKLEIAVPAVEIEVPTLELEVPTLSDTE